MAPSPRAGGGIAAPRHSPYLPTPLERLTVSIFPLILTFGAIFSLLSPETRSAPYYAGEQAHAQTAEEAPSYFARKANVFNVVFVKRGWAWTTFSFFFFVVTRGATDKRRLQAGFRWVGATAWWVLVTQWCFGPPLIDRGFLWTGGKCEDRKDDMFTAVACKAAGGRWRGGHDISGHVFLLVLGSLFLGQEVGWPLLRAAHLRAEERCVVMADGAIKGAGVESDGEQASTEQGLGPAAKTTMVVVGMKLWMLLMTAIYFHTWFEKFSGLMTALVGGYGLYIVPRFVPGLRAVVGLPGI
ncbi:phosphatidylcholine-hydrolyzing phospholipase C [Ophiocordyceps camponoti-floridani]|uniref:Acyl-coenzyme A diphosphatase SCS3 n=1 Tax=Ophiocordyceps camponoti-floridani TaxID=2030778 RepID=A0A8H4VAE2_9HYPO|nr:phosphatidylcholine-hydrolyzing phospholipase C [Ophiocordyceps camponoti-floridani]